MVPAPAPRSVDSRSTSGGGLIAKGDRLMHLDCFECGATVEADDLADLGDRFLAHARTSHEWPYPDQGIRNYAEATQRLTGPSDRLPELGELTIHPVTEDRLDDWAAFFDHDAFVGNPEWAGCYCLEPHVAVQDALEEADVLETQPRGDAPTAARRHLVRVSTSPSGRPAGSTRPCAPTTRCTRPRVKIRPGPGSLASPVSSSPRPIVGTGLPPPCCTGYWPTPPSVERVGSRPTPSPRTTKAMAATSGVPARCTTNTASNR